eukprot:2014861-Prymnesium_polylepis.2
MRIGGRSTKTRTPHRPFGKSTACGIHDHVTLASGPKSGRNVLHEIDMVRPERGGQSCDDVHA